MKAHIYLGVFAAASFAACIPVDIPEPEEGHGTTHAEPAHAAEPEHAEPAHAEAAHEVPAAEEVTHAEEPAVEEAALEEEPAAEEVAEVEEEAEPEETEPAEEAEEVAVEEAAPAPAAGAVDAKVMKKGKKLYAMNCMACHQKDGNGLPGAFPPLAGSEWVTGDPRRPAAIAMMGLTGPIEVKGQKYGSVMAPLVALSKDADLAAVLTYVRNEWGNSASAVDEATVTEVRTALKGKTGPWKSGDEVTAFVEGL